MRNYSLKWLALSFATMFFFTSTASACNWKCQGVKLVVGAIISGVAEGFANSALSGPSASDSEVVVEPSEDDRLIYCPNGSVAKKNSDSICGIPKSGSELAEKFQNLDILTIYCPSGNRYRVPDINDDRLACKALDDHKFLFDSNSVVGFSVYCGDSVFRVPENAPMHVMSCESLILYSNLAYFQSVY